mgnify:CR=1 FL=1
MLKFLNYNKSHSVKNLETFLNKRKFSQKNNTTLVKKIIYNVKKTIIGNGIKKIKLKKLVNAYLKDISENTIIKKVKANKLYLNLL